MCVVRNVFRLLILAVLGLVVDPLAIAQGSDGSKAGQSLRCSVFFRTADGQVKMGAGSFVFLLHATESAKEYIRKVVRSDMSVDSVSLHEDYVMKVQADSAGEAVFNNVPLGGYFVVSDVRWSKKGMIPFTSKKEGGIVLGNALISGNSGPKCIVSN